MYRVVIVDDEISTGRILERYVTTYMPDFEVLHTFKTGTLAWRFLENQEVDILVTDINMPGLSGIELTSRVVERWPDTAVGIITGYSEFEYARQAINLGVSSFLLKPINLHEFQCAVEHMRQQRQRNLQRRVLQSKTSQEIIEEYISDLQEGQLSQNESYHHFAACGFPFQITQCQGKLVQFRLTQMTDAIADDPERTENAITNVLRMTMP
ncbi:MAG: response regulator, partial [Clostridia bacterium]